MPFQDFNIDLIRCLMTQPGTSVLHVRCIWIIGQAWSSL